MTHQICKIVILLAFILQLASSIQAQLEPALDLEMGERETAENDDVLHYSPSPYPLGDVMASSELEGRVQYPPSPSPSPYSPGTEQDYPDYGEYDSPSPSPYIDVMAPEVDDNYGDDYNSPSQAPSPTYYGIPHDQASGDDYNSPSPAPSPTDDGILYDEAYGDDYYSPSQAPSPTDYGMPYDQVYSGSNSIMGTAPPPAEWEYRAEDDAEYLSGEEELDGEENKRGRIGLVIGAVCLVGLGGLVYRRRKINQNKRKQHAYLELSRTGEV